jgi:hypothetical protein
VDAARTEDAERKVLLKAAHTPTKVKSVGEKKKKAFKRPSSSQPTTEAFTPVTKRQRKQVTPRKIAPSAAAGSPAQLQSQSTPKSSKPKQSR